MAARSKAKRVQQSRVSEQYLLAQVNYSRDSETFRDWKNRTEAGDLLYVGALDELFPNESALPLIPYVENKFKNALHDISRLSAEGRGMVKFIAQGDRDRDMKKARIRESINEGYWGFNKMRAAERQYYLDLVGTGTKAACVYYDERSPYPQIDHLDPRYGYPDVRSGRLQTYLHVEVIKERMLARQFPHLGLNSDGENTNDGLFVRYFDENEVAEVVMWGMNRSGAVSSAEITKTWVHGLDCVPVAFEMLDTYDGAFHGLFDQLAGPLMVRNKIARFLVDYIEQSAHAPIFEMGVENWDAEPGPMTVYHGDPNQEKTQMTRIGPAESSGNVWNLLNYMGDQEEKEALQPPSRSGNVSQSIASGSFVDRTQGQLTSVVKEIQDKMASFREQLNEMCMKLDETPDLNYSKPLWRPVAGKKEYTPKEDIDGWYYHEVKFGAAAGLDQINAHQLVQSDLAARLISREEARSEIYYLDDSASSQDKIDRENLQDVIFQRMAQDPATPMSALGSVWLEMKQNGASLEEALEKFMPQIISAEQAAAPQPGIPAAPGQAPPEAEAGVPGPTTAEQELGALQAQAPDLAAVTQRPPLSLIQQRP